MEADTLQAAIASLTLAQELKNWRKRLAWTQARAAAWLHVSVDTYRGWEGGRRKKLQAGPIRARMAQMKPRNAAVGSQ